MNLDAAGFDVAPCDLARERDAVVELWRSGLGHHGQPEAKLAWFYDAHPMGTPSLFIIRKAGTPIGVATVAARRMRLDGNTMDAGVLVDFVVKPEERGFFPALLLQRTLRERTLGRFPLLYGVPNARSEAIVKRAGYRCAGEMVRWALVLRTGPYLARRLPRWIAGGLGAVMDRSRHGLSMLRSASDAALIARWVAAPDERFDALWEASGEDGVLMGIRDRAFLQWRFGRNPFAAHRYFVLEDAAGLRAYAACHVRDDTLHVSDFLVDPALPAGSAALWRSLALDAYREGHASVSMMFLGPDRWKQALSASGFSPRERFPVYAAFAAGTRAAQAPWYFTAGDNDA